MKSRSASAKWRRKCLRRHKRRSTGRDSFSAGLVTWIDQGVPMSRRITMTPITLEECQAEIESLRRKQPDFDELFVDVRDPAGKDIVARLYLQFRDPFSSLRQEGYELTHQKPGKTEKWQYNFSMSESDAARVLHEFNSKYAGMDFEPSLSSSNRYE